MFKFGLLILTTFSHLSMGEHAQTSGKVVRSSGVTSEGIEICASTVISFLLTKPVGFSGIEIDDPIGGGEAVAGQDCIFSKDSRTLTCEQGYFDRSPVTKAVMSLPNALVPSSVVEQGCFLRFSGSLAEKMVKAKLPKKENKKLCCP